MPGSEPLVRIEQLSCDIDGKPILRDVSFMIGRGETVALVGRNGSGKTTLIKHLNGLYRPRSGGVFFDDQRIDERTPPQKASLAGISFQNPNDQFFKSCVEEELRVGLELAQGDREGWLERICDIFDLHEFLDRSPFRLSEGEKKRTAVCSVLAMDPRLLVLDEPTAGQDGRLRLTLAKIVRELNRQGGTILVATHDFDFARAVADRWIVLENGVVVADGPRETIERRSQTAAA